MSSERDPSFKVVTAMPIAAASFTIFWVSSIPELVAPDLGFVWQDKFLHAAAYAFYGTATVIFTTGWLADWIGSSTIRQILAVFLIAGLFAATDEIHQYFVPGRDSDVFDLAADLVGITLSLTTIPFIKKLFA